MFGRRGALETSEQIEAERIALRLSSHPLLREAGSKLRQDMLSYRFATTDEARARLDHALELWTVTILMRRLAANPARPLLLWEFDDTPRRRSGFTFPGGSGFGDNPDHIYRTSFLDNDGRYEIEGQLGATRPLAVIFQTVLGNPGMRITQALHGGPVDVGNHVDLITDRQIRTDRRGRFTLTLSSDTSKRPNHLHLPSGPGRCQLQVRDVLEDWAHCPTRLSIRRTHRSVRTAVSEEQLVTAAAADLPSFVRFWTGATIRFMDKVPVNRLAGPMRRDGGWGYLGQARIALQPRQAILVTAHPRGGRYLGVQFVDSWGVSPDNRNQVSLNLDQVRMNADGSVTFVIGPEDSGAANWIDTRGLHSGFVIMRWQAMPELVPAEGLLKSFELVDIAGLASRMPAGDWRIRPAERQQQLAQHFVAYERRLSC